METSAKQPINVDESFFDIVREIRKYNKVRDPRFGLCWKISIKFLVTGTKGRETRRSSWLGTQRK